MRAAKPLLVSFLAVAAIVPFFPGRASAVGVTYTAPADARASAANPTTNYGRSSRLEVDQSPLHESFVRFAVTVSEPVVRARLRLYVTNGSTNGPEVYPAENTWSETSLTWNSRPVRSGGMLADLGRVSANRYAEWDVTAAVTGTGTYSFAVIADSGDGTTLRSREATSNRPQLVVETEVSSTTTTTTTTTTTVPPPDGTPDLIGAGDIAASGGRQAATAALLGAFPDATVFTAGDNAYNDGTLAQFNNHYAPSWGLYRGRTRPSPGNHDYRTPGAAGYFEYFGAAAGDPGKGYYGFDLHDNWHIVVLNTEIDHGAGSAQEQWLRADLAAHAAMNIAAIFHKPRFSSGNRAGFVSTASLWRALYEYRAEFVVSAHNHHYERFAPQTPSGVADQNGIREFVVGTGGAGLYAFGTTQPNSEVRNNTTHGVLALLLEPDSYAWQFIPVAGRTFSDTGTQPVSR